jgi:hypothetical protein
MRSPGYRLQAIARRRKTDTIGNASAIIRPLFLFRPGAATSRPDVSYTKRCFGVDEHGNLAAHRKGVHPFLLHHEGAFPVMDVDEGFRTIDFGQFNLAGNGDIPLFLAGKPQVVGSEGESVGSGQIGKVAGQAGSAMLSPMKAPPLVTVLSRALMGGSLNTSAALRVSGR